MQKQYNIDLANRPSKNISAYMTSCEKYKNFLNDKNMRIATILNLKTD